MVESWNLDVVKMPTLEDIYCRKISSGRWLNPPADNTISRQWDLRVSAAALKPQHYGARLLTMSYNFQGVVDLGWNTVFRLRTK